MTSGRKILTSQVYRGKVPLATARVKGIKFSFMTWFLRRDALNKWKCRLGNKATYRALIKVFYDADKPEYADIVCTVLSNSNSKFFQAHKCMIF